MEKVIVKVSKTKNNFAAVVKELDGFVCTAQTLQKLKKEVKDGIDFHLEGLKEDNDYIPEKFYKDYYLKFKWNIKDIFLYYTGIYKLF